MPSNNNGDIKFYGGTFEIGIFKNGYEFADLIGSACEYRNIETSAVISASELKNSVPFKVVCDHTWASGVCSNCGYVCPHENVSGTTCSDCNATLLIKIENTTTTRYFSSVESAFAALSDGDTILVLNDFTMTEGVKTDKNVTFDLNGKKITASQKGSPMLKFNGKTTVKDSSENKTGEVNTWIQVECKVALGEDEIYCSYVESGIFSDMIHFGSNTLITGGTYSYASPSDNATNVKVEGGTFNVVDDESQFSVGSKSLTISGGTFNSQLYVSVSPTSITITGGTFAEIYIPGTERDGVELRLSGGTFDSISAGPYNYEDFIAEGYVYKNVETSEIVMPENMSANVKVAVVECPHSWTNGVCNYCGDVCGLMYGDYDKNNHVGEQEWLKTDKTHKKYWNCCNAPIIEEENHEWNENTCAVCGIVAVAQITDEAGTIKYVSFTDALAALKDGDTLTLLQDVTISGEKRIGDSVTIDLNGKTIKGDENSNLNLLYFCGNISHKILVIKNSASTIAKIETKVETMYFDTSVTGKVLFEDEVSIDGDFVVSGGNNGFKNLRIMGNGVIATFTDAFTVSDTLTLTNPTTTINSLCNIENLVVGDRDFGECTLSITGASVGTLTLKKRATSVKLAESGYTSIILDGTSLTYVDLLADGQAYAVDSDTNFVAPTAISASTANIQVRICTNHSWSEGKCVYCFKVCEHPSWNDEHKCAICGEDCTHDWKNGTCEVCGKVCAHDGGNSSEATCCTKATCAICGERHGDLNENNHEGEPTWNKTVTTHKKYWNCCNAPIVEEENHEWHDGTCAECNYVCEHYWIDGTCDYCGTKCEHAHWTNGVCDNCSASCSHTGGNATCKTQAICTTCGMSYGDYDKSNHEGEQEWTTTETTHAKHWNCCGDIVIAEESHEWDENGVCSECDYRCEHAAWTDGVCDNCGKNCEHDWENGVCTICEKVCAHTGGTATCIEKAICEICGSSYGEINETHHAHLVEVKATASTVTTAGNIAHYHCTDCDKRFSDVLAITEVTLESVALPKLPPAVVSGGEGKYVKNSGESLTVKSNALLSDFVAVYVDGKEISSDNYVLGEDGLSVKFKSSYLDSCAVGTHEVSVRSISGNADTTFTIESAPDEGLSGGAWAGIGIAIAAAVIGAMMGIMLVAKKRG